MADVQVVLLETVPNLGDIGDVRSVAGGYARNFLLPRRLAVPATRQRLDDAQFQTELQDRREENARREAQHLADMIQGATLTIYVQVGGQGRMHGQITNRDVAVALLEQHGAEIDRHLIQIDSPIRSLGRYLVPIRLAAGLEASVMLDVVEQEDEPEPVAEDEEEEAEDEFGVSHLGR
ncbi:MAG: 50S ribosomal protein L9 [Chloroflexota bacterium]|nr:50S ribosomal protein L9 [Chloroflexota bacterium]